MHGPLKGIRILDLTTMVSGPMATMMLADQGADVIKIEPVHGEQMRHMGHSVNEVSAPYYNCNRGKRSLSLDLKTEAGMEIIKDLVKTADVFVQNFRPGAIERMGLGEDILRELNPNIIMVSISGFGETGPYSHKRVYDPIVQALCCATDIQADRATGRPQMFRIIIADKVTSLTAAQAITAALFARLNGGEGQHIKLSMLDSMISFFWPEGMAGLTYGDMEIDVTKVQGTMDLIYPTKDNYITAGAITDSEWRGMCRAINREDLISDERFATSKVRFDNSQLRKELVSEEIMKWDSEEILNRLDSEDVPCAPLLKRTQLLENEQILINQTIDRTVHEGFGEVRQARPAALFDKTPSSISGPAPKLGQHNEEIMTELGYSADKISRLVSRS